jgi:hypothetical protein
MRHLDSLVFQREFVDNVSGLAGVIGWSTDAIVLNDETPLVSCHLRWLADSKDIRCVFIRLHSFPAY